MWLIVVALAAVLQLANCGWSPSDALQEHNLRKGVLSVSMRQDINKWQTENAAKEALNKLPISRHPDVVVTSDTRGNLGPASVIVQDPPGTDWIKDRWQAASDMGGTAIPGAHWVMLDFKKPVTVECIVLDWEAAYAENYRIELRNKLDDDDAGWTVIYDGSKEHHRQYRTVKRSGQSPGVKYEMPLHVVHRIELTELNAIVKQMEFRYLRVYIVKPAAGWGVSLWQVDVYGHRVQEVGNR